MATDGLPRTSLVLGELVDIDIAVGGDAQTGMVATQQSHLRVNHRLEPCFQLHGISLAETAYAEILHAVVDLIDRKPCLITGGTLREADVHLCHDVGSLLTAAHERWVIVFRERSSGMEAERAVVEELVVGGDGVLEINPCGMGERLGEKALERRDVGGIDSFSAIHHRPAAFGPLDGSDEGLATQMVVHPAKLAISQEGDPPRAVGSLDKVAVPRALHALRLSLHAAVREDGVVGTGLIGAFYAAAAGDGERVGELGAAFRDEQVVIAILLIDVRPLGVSSAGATPEEAAFRELLAGVGIDGAEGNGVVGVADHVAAAIVVPEERGVDAPLLQPARFAPRAEGIGGGDDEVAPSAHEGGDHVEGAVVIAEGGGIDARPRRGAVERQLRGPAEDVAYLLPMDEVGGVIKRHAGEVLERRVHQIVVVPHTADGRVGMEAGDDGVRDIDDCLRRHSAETEGQQQHSEAVPERSKS